MTDTDEIEARGQEQQHGLERRLTECAGALEAHGFKAEAELAREALAALSYYKAGLLRLRPEYVPKLIRMQHLVRGDAPAYTHMRAGPGILDAVCNQWGAVSVRSANGQMLGLKPGEFEVVTWTRNPS